MALSSGTSFQLVNSNEQFETVFAIKLSDELLTTLLAKEKRPALKLRFSADSTGVRITHLFLFKIAKEIPVY